MSLCPCEVNRQGHIAVDGKCTVAGRQTQTKSFVFNRRREQVATKAAHSTPQKQQIHNCQNPSGTHSFT